MKARYKQAKKDYLALTGKIPKKVKKYVKRAIKGSEELKFSALEYINMSVTSTFAIACNPCNMVQGDTSATRTGNQILVDKIEWNLTALYGDNVNTMRLVLLVSTQTNGVDMSSGNLFQGFGTAGTNSLLSAQTNNMFRIIFDKQITLTSYTVITAVGAGPFNSSSVKQIRGSYRFKYPLKVLYTGNAGTVADITKNAIQLVAFSDSTIAVHPVLNGCVRIRFRDA